MSRKCARWLPLALVLGTTLARAELRPQGETLVLSEAPGAELPLTVRVRVAATTSTTAPPGMPATQVLPVTSWQKDTSNGNTSLLGEVTGGASLGDLKISMRWQHNAEGAYTLQAEAQALSPVWISLLSIEVEFPDGTANLGGRELRMHALGRAAALSGLDPKWLIVYPSFSSSSSSLPQATADLDSAAQFTAAVTPRAPLAARARPTRRSLRMAAAKRRPRGAAMAWTLFVPDEVDGLTALRQGSHILARIDLLSTEARPFSHFVACTDNWRAPNHRQSLAARLVLPDEPIHAELSFYSGAATPIFKARYPDGRNAALVITDHADQTAAVTLRALIGGTSDVTSPVWGKGGLLGHGLSITKSLWMSSGEPAPPPLYHAPPPIALLNHGGHVSRQSTILAFRSRYGRPQVDATGGGRPQLDDPEVVEMADRMVRIGWEIVPHSATPLRDERSRTEMALDWFQRYKARTWIDHQPYTNCEALTNQGYQAGPFGIVDLLHKFGYGYAWSGVDVPPGPLNLLSPRRLDRYAPVLWPVGRLWSGTPTGLFLFRTMMTYIDSAKFFKLYTPKALDQLERERGLHIAHTYLEVFHPPTSPLVKRNLMIPGKRLGEVVPDPRLDRLFANFEEHVTRGALWVPTLSQLGDHMRAMAAVTVRLEADGSAVLRSPQALTGATFVLPHPGLQVLIDGQPPKGQRTSHKETTFWVDLPADREVHVMLLDAHGEMVVFRRLPESKGLVAHRTS